MEIEIGELLMCQDDGGCEGHLTAGKAYVVQGYLAEDGLQWIYVNNDRGMSSPYFVSRFCRVPPLKKEDAAFVSDAVQRPSHYTQGTIECIDAIESALTREEFIGALKFQVMKYTWRMGRKDAASQDAAKAAWYADRLTKALGK